MSEHHHEHAVPDTGARLAIVIGLNFFITIVEIIGGIISGSLSLLSDALHNFSDGIAIIIAWIAIKLEKKERSDTYTFGLKRAQVLAAVINAGTLVALSIYLFFEAWQRFSDPQPISGWIMTSVASIGLLANIIGTWLLYRDAQQNMNLKAAYLHLFSDAISSIGVIIGGLAITFFHIYWIDPILTALIALYVLKESIEILWRALGIFMLSTPKNISLAEVRTSVLNISGVAGIHHVHLWEVSEHDIKFEAHITTTEKLLYKTEQIRKDIESTLHDEFEINHVLIQFEQIDSDCTTKNLN